MTADTTGDGRVDDIGEVVRCQHRVLRRLFGDVEAARGRRRLEVLEDLVRYLAVHETLEEDLVYPALRAAGPDEARVADARRDEEREATAMLQRPPGRG
ncbi:MAG TPA: hemerythrin domain-containing protein, partial [Solirubrobacterales bacterium]|nr:hemerythrin domain-containing protein [Solirubrobacterales bacterium]